MTQSTLELAVRRFTPDGPVSGPPVLLVHGFTSDGESDWLGSGWPAALTAAGRVVLVPDLPGHGTSPVPRGVADALPSAMVAALLDVVASESSGPVNVVAYSLGARLAWELPKASVTVSHLVLGGISPREPFGALDTEVLLAVAEQGADPGDPLTGMVASMITAPGRNTRALVTCVEGLKAEPFSPSPSDIDVPALFVAGDADPVAAGIEELVELVDGAQLWKVPGDHLSTLHGPDFQRVAVDFLTTPR
ncbi:alpha/beta fold hydrolase [Phytoactinopolyspora limicola]|uniref:alpha/beta fold hydrolase n=1 Tax=Phytoactinopolyspora limicola TaxID=2715536 RepID=UPI001407634F|nr:alpha/beta fold hydrolase [Phytoactinopolyspora limicola]